MQKPPAGHAPVSAAFSPVFQLRTYLAAAQRAKAHRSPSETEGGPSEFYITGNLAHWDRTSRLAEIGVPTVLISGEHDESTPAINRALQRAIPGARWVLRKGCSHLAHVEAPERYLHIVQDFLDSL